MKRAWLVFGALALATPMSAVAGNLTIRGGGFFPRAEGSSCTVVPEGTSVPLFCDLSDLYSRTPSGDEIPPGLQKSDWNGFTGGIAYFSKVGPNVELGASLDGYERKLDTNYRRYTRPNGSEIFQTLRLRTIPMSVAVRFVPTSRRARIAPYLEVGGDAVSYKYEEFGDFIDFSDDSLPVSPDSFVSEGFAFGFHVAGGVKVPINSDFSIVGEGRYLRAKHQMNDDFPANEIDLGGWSATVGFNIRF